MATPVTPPARHKFPPRPRTLPSRPATVRSYNGKVRGFIESAGDLPLTAYTAESMKTYRDCLDVSPATMRQYFAPLQTLWRWAAVEYPLFSSLIFPKINLPQITKTVEETRWKAFDDNQIKDVWSLLNDAWGPDSASRLTLSRRAAFLMAIRVMLYTGMRPSEAFRITPGDVQDGVLHIRHTKTKSPRKIPLASALADFPAFLNAGGFAGELVEAKPESLAGTLRDSFRVIIRAGGLTDDRHVLYSLKDTLIERLQRAGVTDDTMRGIIGHVTGQRALRNYKTPFGQSVHGMKTMREALDGITYW